MFYRRKYPDLQYTIYVIIGNELTWTKLRIARGLLQWGTAC